MRDVTTSTRWTANDLEARIVRYGDLRPCYNAFIDTRTPGSEAKENFTIIGPGVSENPEQYVHIAEPHGFNIGGARQPPGCVNSQHSHDTAEVFIVHSGTWSFNFGEHGDAARVICRPGDTISLPTGIFRGFTNIGEDIGFLWAVLGGDDPGRVLWAPEVFDMAAEYGLVLLENGLLVDIVAGQTLPDDIGPMPRTSADQAAAMQTPSATEAEALVVRAADVSAALIGPGAPLDWDHGFALDRLIIDGAAEHELAGTVIFINEGRLSFAIDGVVVALRQGDTMTVPPGARMTDMKGDAATLFVVRTA